MSQEGNPIEGARITLFSKEQGFYQELFSDKSGFFQACGLPFGSFALVFEATGCVTHFIDDILFEPSRSLYIKVILKGEDAAELPSLLPVRMDFSPHPTQTTINEHQLQSLPSGNDVWSVIENQDLSATTNRIDVGGLWTTIPALFSSRGGCSWTQNLYLLNGMDVTDPSWTGMPLFIPDFFSLRFFQLRNADHPASHLSPGAYFNLIPKEGSSKLRGSLSAFTTNKHLSSSNISPALEAEGILESHTIGSLRNFNAQAGGPLVQDKLFFFTSLTSLSLTRDLAEFESDDESSLLSGLITLKYKSHKNTFSFLWTGQVAHSPSSGAGRKIPFSSTLDKKDLFNVFQIFWNRNPNPHHNIKAGLSFSRGNFHSRFQEGISEPHAVEMFRDPLGGAAALSGRDDRNMLTMKAEATSLVGRLSTIHHRLNYGVQLQYASSSSEKKILDNIHLRFLDGMPFEVAKFNTPALSKRRAFHFHLFAQDTVTFSGLFSITGGIHLAYSRGWVPSGDSPSSWGRSPEDPPEKALEIAWLNLSPRLGITVPLSKKKTSFLRISGARYFFTLPLNYLDYGNPGAMGSLVYTWEDGNSNRKFEAGETGSLIRREGPLFSSIAPDLGRPYTDEFSISFVQDLGENLYFSLAGFYRETRNLIETANSGVPFSAYDPVTVFDIGDDRIPGTHDDLVFTVHNRRKEYLGRDFFLLSNGDSVKRVSRYRGLDLMLVKKFNQRSVFFLSLTATEGIGTTSPGNTEWENDDGVVGSLFNDPNTLINAKGRVRFDRAYTGRIGFSFFLPFGIQLGGIIKYYDGQPFARKIIVIGMNQGPFILQAHPRGVARYEYNMTVDLRLEKTIHLGRTRLRLILDGFNIFNRDLATEENEWTGPEFPLRFATEIQSPRVFRLGLSYEF